MNKTVFITGASSGIGCATAQLFSKQGWNVVATMRNPQKDSPLRLLKNVLVTRLDVTDESTIGTALTDAIEKFGRVDALVNNAGYGMVGVFEASPAKSVRKLFETNLFGVMNVTRAFLPHFRRNKSGTIINISSVGGRLCMPLFSTYHATKFAIEGLSESLRFELKPLGIRVKLVEPGGVRTDFNNRSLETVDASSWPDYSDYQNRVIEKIAKAAESGETAEYTARDIYRAVTDKSSKLRYSSGRLARTILLSRPFVPDAVFRTAMEKNFS